MGHAGPAVARRRPRARTRRRRGRRLALDQAATRHYQGRNRESIRWAERAAADALATDDLGLLANAHLHLEMAHSMLGDGQAAGYADKAVALFEEIGDRVGLAHALINSGLTAYDEGRWGDARACYERAAEVATTTGNVTQVATTQLNTAFLLAELGETDRAAVLCASSAAGVPGQRQRADPRLRRLAARPGWRCGPATCRRPASTLAVARRRFDDNGARQMVLDCDVAGVEVLLVAGDDVAAAVRGLAVCWPRSMPSDRPSCCPSPSGASCPMRPAASATADAALAAAEQAVALARDHGARVELALSLDAAAHAQRALGPCRGRRVARRARRPPRRPRHPAHDPPARGRLTPGSSPSVILRDAGARRAVRDPSAER